MSAFRHHVKNVAWSFRTLFGKTALSLFANLASYPQVPAINRLRAAIDDAYRAADMLYDSFPGNSGREDLEHCQVTKVDPNTLEYGIWYPDPNGYVYVGGRPGLLAHHDLGPLDTANACLPKVQANHPDARVVSRPVHPWNVA